MGPLVLLLLILISRLVQATCECGYSARIADHDEPVIFTDLIETQFSQAKDMSQETDWVAQQFNVSAEAGRGDYGKAFAPSNVAVDNGLELRVGRNTTEDRLVSSAEIDTKRLDLRWGSYRAGLKLTSVAGTCAAFFWYFNDTQEIDVEFLSREFDQERGIYPVNLVVQSRLSMESGYDASNTGTFQRVNLTFDPTTAYHEYRFDYMAGQVFFYADSELLGQMNGSAMPSAAGHLILQHWSNGNPFWSGGPPDQDAVITVSYVKAYFNSSSGAGTRNSCHDAGADRAICAIPDVTAVNASTGGDFFTKKINQPHSDGDANDGGDDKENVSHALDGALVMAAAWALTALLWMELMVTT